MHPELLKIACELYQTHPSKLEPLSGGNYNAVYQFPITTAPRSLNSHEANVEGKYAILRVGVEDTPTDQTLAMLTWVDFLACNGAPVSRPIYSTKGNPFESIEFDHVRYTLTAFDKSKGILAERIPPSEWTDDLFRNIGKATGKMHHISSTYKPQNLALTRPHWYDSYEIRDANTKLAVYSNPTLPRLNSLMERLQRFPTSPADYGLIHDDLHFANFFIQPTGQVTIFDFDDCVYGWFVMDIAMALFDILVLFDDPGDTAKQSFARRFLSNYLEGYRQEMPIERYWLVQIPLFLKLKELCIYASLLGHAEVDQFDTWVGKFMRGRTARMDQDIPYVDIDFTVF